MIIHMGARVTSPEDLASEFQVQGPYNRLPIVNGCEMFGARTRPMGNAVPPLVLPDVPSDG